MKNDITVYPDFYKAIQSQELVFLFGAGISSALTNNHSLSWRQWIVNGIDKLKDKHLAASYKHLLYSDDSTENLVVAAGKVLSSAKADGVYADWMHESFETHTVTNTTLANTLKKFLITQDVFVTTNYDLLLEAATGLSAISYKEPDKAFRMLDRKKSEAVLHIHGIYNSAEGIDSIVADKPQYDTVLDDKGAQFIQNILGTRTLIFVGCGQTAEDPNVSCFIKFAATYLHLERDYYFLHKSGDEPNGSPDNIKSIPYGDAYSDLSAFLEDMAQERLKAKVEKYPIIGRTVTAHKPDPYGLSEYHYSNEYLKFRGRKIELAQLNVFTETDKKFQWWAVTGQGGSGKSRLAFEFLRVCQRKWFGFFLNFNVSEESVEQFQPFNDTFIVIDYVKGNEKKLAKTVSLLADKFKPLAYKLRLLFLERDNILMSGSWYDSLISAMDVHHKAEFNDAEYNADLITRKHRFLYLDDLDAASVIGLIGDMCNKKGLPEDKIRDKKLKDDYAKKFEQLKFRPFFLQIFVETWIANGCIAVEYANYKSLLEIVVKREQERILSIFGGDVNVFNALILLIIRASASDGITVKELETLYPTEWHTVETYVKNHSLSGKQKNEYLYSLLSDTTQALNSSESNLKPLYPDIIKEYIFLYYLDEEKIVELSQKFRNECPNEYNTFLSRCIIDFQGDECLMGAIRKMSADYTNTNAMKVRLALTEYKVIHTVDEGSLFFDLAFKEYEYWSKAVINNDNRSIVMEGLYHCVWQFFGWSQIEKASEAVTRIYNFKCGNELQIVKAGYLIEFVHYLTEENGIDIAQNIIKQALRAINELKDPYEKTDLKFKIRREMLVSYVYYKRWDKVKELLKKIYNSVDWENEKQVEYYAYICFSGANLCFKTGAVEKILVFANRLQDLAEDYGAQKRKIYFNDKVHYYYLYTKYIKTEIMTISLFKINFKKYGLRTIDALIWEIEANEMISDFAGLLVGAWALKVGLYDVTNNEADRYLKRASGFLKKYPDNALLAAKFLRLLTVTYKYTYKKTIPKTAVDTSYAVMLRFLQDETVLAEFFEMLKHSEKIGSLNKYIANKGVVAALFKYRMTDYLLPLPIKSKPSKRKHKNPEKIYKRKDNSKERHGKYKVYNIIRKERWRCVPKTGRTPKKR